MRPRVGVTRAVEQAQELIDALDAAGFEPVALPMTRTEFVDPGPLAAALRHAGSVGVAFASMHGVHACAAAVGPQRLADVLRGALVVAVGPRTASALDSLGVAPINVPDRADAEGVLDWILASPEGPRRSWVLPRAEGGRPTIEDGLRAQGWRVEPVVAYRTVPLRDGAPLRQAVREGLAAVTFAASSAVTTFIDLLGSGLLLDGVAVVTIGPSTSATSRTHGLPVAAEADAPSIAALVDAVRRALGTP